MLYIEEYEYLRVGKAEHVFAMLAPDTSSQIMTKKISSTYS